MFCNFIYRFNILSTFNTECKILWTFSYHTLIMASYGNEQIQKIKLLIESQISVHYSANIKMRLNILGN